MNARDELMLDSMGATPTGFEIKTHAGGPETAETLLFIADSMRDALDGHDAPNYLEMEVKASDGKRYIMTLQRSGKVTPHQARVKAEEALEASKPRTITTLEELVALPAGSVFRDDNGRLWEWEHIGYGGIDKALSAMGVGSMLSPACFRQFPATVLHEPVAS